MQAENIELKKKTIKTMSKNAGGYMGIQIGKLGPAVGSMWKGKNVYRSYNPFVKTPHTPGQQEQRASLSSRTGICYPTSMAKFSDLSILARVFSPGGSLLK